MRECALTFVRGVCMYVFKSVFMGVTAYLHASVSVYVFVCEFVYFFAWISINQETDILLGIV